MIRKINDFLDKPVTPKFMSLTNIFLGAAALLGCATVAVSGYLAFSKAINYDQLSTALAVGTSMLGGSLSAMATMNWSNFKNKKRPKRQP